MNLLIIVLLIVLVFGGGSVWTGPTYGWSYGGGIGLVGLVLIVVLLARGGL